MVILVIKLISIFLVLIIINIIKLNNNIFLYCRNNVLELFFVFVVSVMV